ncbi:hypothetical protein NPIL_338531 [Nephila pilipes]|uniref:Uncharacterized protein n=1 Tax=Nephila pilipes TaxID=299642 RepID=A0A8X6K0P1_NEPPI|nr:hypothetical protein NPIL_338531 [Nephila pilipes]
MRPAIKKPYSPLSLYPGLRLAGEVTPGEVSRLSQWDNYFLPHRNMPFTIRYEQISRVPAQEVHSQELVSIPAITTRTGRVNKPLQQHEMQRLIFSIVLDFIGESA